MMKLSPEQTQNVMNSTILLQSLQGPIGEGPLSQRAEQPAMPSRDMTAQLNSVVPTMGLV